MGVVILAIFAGALSLAGLGEKKSAGPALTPGPDRPTGNPDNGNSVSHATDGRLMDVRASEGGPQVVSSGADPITGQTSAPNGANVLTAPSPTVHLVQTGMVKTVGLTQQQVGDRVQELNQRTASVIM